MLEFLNLNKLICKFHFRSVTQNNLNKKVVALKRKRESDIIRADFKFD